MAWVSVYDLMTRIILERTQTGIDQQGAMKPRGTAATKLSRGGTNTEIVFRLGINQRQVLRIIVCNEGSCWGGSRVSRLVLWWCVGVGVTEVDH